MSFIFCKFSISNITPISTDRPLTSTLVLVFKFMESKCLFTNNRGKQTKGHNSCNSPGACFGVGNYEIGYNSCNWAMACNYLGYGHNGFADIGHGSCNGFNACQWDGKDTKTKIGNGSCSNTDACRLNRGTIGNNACKEHAACIDNEGTIDDGCCNYKDACKGNKGHIKYGDSECCGSGDSRWTNCAPFNWCHGDEKQVDKSSYGCWWGQHKIKCAKSYC